MRSNQSRGPGRSRRCFGHSPLPCIDDREVCCRNCEEKSKNGSSRPTRIRWCELCSSYHSAKNYRREREKCASIAGSTINKEYQPVLANEVHLCEESSASEGCNSHSLFDEISSSSLLLTTSNKTSDQYLRKEIKANSDIDRVLDDEIKYWSKDETYAPISLSPNKAAVDINISQISEMVSAAQKSVAGPSHENSLLGILRKSKALAKRGDFVAAEISFREVIKGRSIRSHELGEEECLIIATFFGLATTWTSLAIMRRQPLLARMAQRIMSSVYERRVRFLGSDHVETIETLHQMGLSIEASGHFLKATGCLIEALNGFAVVFGKDDDSTVAARQDLARILLGLGSTALLQGLDSDVDFVEAYFTQLSFYVHRGNDIKLGNDCEENEETRNCGINSDESSRTRACLHFDQADFTKSEDSVKHSASEFGETHFPHENFISDQLMRGICFQHFDEEDSKFSASYHRKTIYKCLVKLERIETLQLRRDQSTLIDALKIIARG